MSKGVVPRWWVFYVDGEKWLSDPPQESKVYDWWTCDEEARKGDLGLIYAKRPVSGLVGVFRVTSNARSKRQEFSSHSYACPVECVSVFDAPLTLAQMRDDKELSRHWRLVSRSFQSHFGRPPQIEPGIVEILATRIPNLKRLTNKSRRERPA